MAAKKHLIYNDPLRVALIKPVGQSLENYTNALSQIDQIALDEMEDAIDFSEIKDNIESVIADLTEIRDEIALTGSLTVDLDDRSQLVLSDAELLLSDRWLAALLQGRMLPWMGC